MLTKILHAWHLYALKQFKRRMEKKKAKKMLKMQKAKEEAANTTKSKDKHSTSFRQATKSQRSKAASAAATKAVVQGKGKTSRDAVTVPLGLLQHTESLRELPVHDKSMERKLRKQASLQKIEQ